MVPIADAIGPNVVSDPVPVGDWGKRVRSVGRRAGVIVVVRGGLGLELGLGRVRASLRAKQEQRLDEAAPKVSTMM